MPRNGVRSTYSQCPVQIRMHDENGLCSTGTAFFYAHGVDWYLITNGHNFSGRHFLTKEPLTPGRLPTHIEVHISTYLGAPPYLPETKFTTASARVDIYRDYEPIWFEHPALGALCDVVALPMERPASCPPFMHNAANLISNTKIPVKPGCSSFVIGFPRSLSVGFGLPLWKSGYIASEPHYDVSIRGELAPIGGLAGGTIIPAFFIDTLTREGMSGSPVFAAYTGTWDTNDPYSDFDPASAEFWTRNDIAIGANALEFIGCYSGRVGRNEEGAALGLCWRADVIDAICLAKVVAKHPHIVTGAT
jgi:hypothetical protein